MFKTLMLLSQPAEHLDHRLAGSAGRRPAQSCYSMKADKR